MEEEFKEYSDSDEGFEKDEIILDDLKKSRKRTFLDKQDSVFGLELNSDDDVGKDEEDISDIDMGSDIEDRDDDKLPDDRAWGHKKKTFYKTDFIDQDYAGGYGAEEEEVAKMEEEEAKNIQKRIMEQLSDAAFSLEDIADANIPVDGKSKAIEKDLSHLSKRQKLDLFKKEAPEFPNLVDDFLIKLQYVRERIIPIFNLINEGKLMKKTSAAEFLETKFRVIMNYCTNIAFYLVLKAKRIQVKDHPVLKCLFRYRQLLYQMQPADDAIIQPKVDQILAAYATNEPISGTKKALKKKKLLKTLKKTMQERDTDKESDSFHTVNTSEMPNMSEDSQSDIEETIRDSEFEREEKEIKKEKRAITYEMAKNKGLTPKRNKDQRNPRVKHRNKFRKAIIRRRGQVRMSRKEIPVYTGEPTGIKIGLKKGRKLM